MNSKFELTFGVTVKLKKGNKIFFLELECLFHCPNDSSYATSQLYSTLCNPQKERRIKERKISWQKTVNTILG